MAFVSESMTVPEAANRLGISRTTAYQEIAAGRLPCRRLGPKGGKIVVTEEDLEAYWEGCRRAKLPDLHEPLQYIKLDRRKVARLA